MDRINELEGVMIVAFDIKLKGEDESTALINIEVDIGKKQTVFARIGEIAEEKELLVINEV
jgi:ACT domain-containing protein